MTYRSLPIYSKALIVACNVIGRGAKSQFYKILKDCGLSYGYQTYNKWFISDTFDVNYYDFEIIVNACRIPTAFFTDKALAQKANEKSIVSKSEWHFVKIDLDAYINDCYRKIHTKSGVQNYLGIDRNTVDKFIDNRTDLKIPNILMGRIYGWLKTNHEEAHNYITDINPIYTGNIQYDMAELDRKEAFLASESLGDYNSFSSLHTSTSRSTSPLTREDIYKARQHIENNYSLPNDANHQLLMWKLVYKRMGELIYNSYLTDEEKVFKLHALVSQRIQQKSGNQ